jgi:hypothetical protein
MSKMNNKISFFKKNWICRGKNHQEFPYFINVEYFQLLNNSKIQYFKYLSIINLFYISCLIKAIVHIQKRNCAIFSWLLWVTGWFFSIWVLAHLPTNCIHVHVNWVKFYQIFYPNMTWTLACNFLHADIKR